MENTRVKNTQMESTAGATRTGAAKKAYASPELIRHEPLPKITFDTSIGGGQIVIP